MHEVIRKVDGRNALQPCIKMQQRSQNSRNHIEATLKAKSQSRVAHPQSRNTHARHKEELNMATKTIH